MTAHLVFKDTSVEDIPEVWYVETTDNGILLYLLTGEVVGVGKNVLSDFKLVQSTGLPINLERSCTNA